ncbi:MAG: signal peptidase I [Lysinibacillus sp.]
MEDKLRSLKNNTNFLSHVTFTKQNKQNVHRRLTKHKKNVFPYSVVAFMFTITMVIGLFYLSKPTETIIDSATPQKLPTLAVTGEQYTIEWLSDAMDRGNHDFDTNVHGALIVDPSIKTIERGQVAYYQLPDTNNEDNMYIGRIVGLPGETIEIKEGHVWIDGKKLEAFYAGATMRGLTEEAYFETTSPENIVNEASTREYFRTNMEAITLKENEYFVLVDQWWRGTDSRTFGPVQNDRIEGIIIGYEQ